MLASPIVVALSGHLSEEALSGCRAPVRSRLLQLAPEQRACLLIDALCMTDYDHAARELFVRFAAEHRNRVRRVAIVTDNKLWQMVIAAMSLASGQSMRGFPARDLANAWLEG